MTYQDPHPEIPEQYARHLRAIPRIGESCVNCGEPVTENIRAGSWYHSRTGDYECPAPALEREVIEAAIAWRRNEQQPSGIYFTADFTAGLREAVDALIAARKERE